jgi:7,8-dihydroneopterin aldolase/epimerase/oxygenase
MTASPVKFVEPPKIADAERRIRHIFIRNLMVPCSIDVYRREKDAEQRVRINLDLTATEGNRPIYDDIRNVICYEQRAPGGGTDLQPGPR